MKTRLNETADVNPPDEEDCGKRVLPGHECGLLDANLRALVAKQPFFAGMKPNQLSLLADSALMMQFEAGEWIFLEGDLANRFYLILDGQVVLEAETEAGARVPIQVVGPGDDLGWSWLFLPYYFHFSARAIAPTRVICFYATHLREQCDQDHEFGYQLIKRIARVTISRLQATRKQLLRNNEPRQTSA